MKNILKLGIILALFSTAACVGLALVYTSTKKIIDQRTQADLEGALKEFFPDMDDFQEITGAIQSEEPSVQFKAEYQVTRAGAVIGVALQAVRPSYGGPLMVLVGVGIDGKIRKIKILEHTDTPGLGANANSPSYFVNREKGITFSSQFYEKGVQDPFKLNGDVSAITAATITSTAVNTAVQASGLAGSAWLIAQGGSK